MVPKIQCCVTQGPVVESQLRERSVPGAQIENTAPEIPPRRRDAYSGLATSDPALTSAGRHGLNRTTAKHTGAVLAMMVFGYGASAAAQLPPEIEMDRFLLQAEQAVDSG